MVDVAVEVPVGEPRDDVFLIAPKRETDGHLVNLDGVPAEGRINEHVSGLQREMRRLREDVIEFALHFVVIEGFRELDIFGDNAECVCGNLIRCEALRELFAGVPFLVAVQLEEKIGIDGVVPVG